jgi:GLPGLI family protein
MKYLLLTFSIFTLNLYSQHKGIVRYGQIESITLKGASGPDFNSYLAFNNNASYYVAAKDSLDSSTVFERTYYNADATQGISRRVYTTPTGNQVYYNRKKDSSYWNQWNGFYVAEKKPKIDWKLSNETKKIGSYTVNKAIGKFRGRTYTAWYTQEIPLPYGPWKLQGLPGLILEAYDTDKELMIYFKSIAYPTNQSVTVTQIKNNDNTPVNWKTLDDFKAKTEGIYSRMLSSSILIAQKLDTEVPEEKIKSEALLESF